VQSICRSDRMVTVPEQPSPTQRVGHGAALTRPRPVPPHLSARPALRPVPASAATSRAGRDWAAAGAVLVGGDCADVASIPTWRTAR
jgi:hypothetical protein